MMEIVSMAEQQEILAARAVDGNGAYDVRFSIGPHRLYRSAHSATDALDMLDAAHAESGRVRVVWKRRDELTWQQDREGLAAVVAQLAHDVPPPARPMIGDDDVAALRNALVATAMLADSAVRDGGVTSPDRSTPI